MLAEALTDLVAGISFVRGMRWNASGVVFSRPVRWFVALLGNSVLPFSYAGLRSGRVTRGLRQSDSPEIEVSEAAAYWQAMSDNQIVIHVPIDCTFRKANQVPNSAPCFQLARGWLALNP